MSERVTSPPNLRSLPFFARLPDAAIRTLEGSLRREYVLRGAVLRGNSPPAETLLIVCSGRLKGRPSGGAYGDGNEEIGPGGWFGADAVMLGPREQGTIIAAEDSDLATISRASIDDLLRRSLPEALGATPRDLPGTATDSPPDIGVMSTGSSKPDRHRIGLALSGGGAKAFAHLGVLKLLCEIGIPIDVVAGTSAGAIAGALLCAGKSVPEMFQLAEDLRRNVLRREGMWDFLNPPTVGLIRGERTRALYDQMLDGATFEQLETPLAIPAADIVTGETVLFRKGRVSEAIRASAGIPGLYAPWLSQGRYLVEGGLVNPLPIGLVRRIGADIVIACDVTGCPQEILGETVEAQAPNLIGLISARSAAILDRHAADQVSDAEILIRPDVEDYDVLDYPLAENLIELGEDAAKAMLPEIRKALEMRPPATRCPGASHSTSFSAGGSDG